ncbi:hypothetical protein ATO12_15930 [Aquimarina atlantica]|uniref:Uncharacterized protein n=1 Tax=Aquimarina atlantica TaxID=1317122 RepID=A0A023BUD7_9FLAO|nr:hypothetical protein [Aquimarina atlantica]EZH73428.1 hypothetical protein ATO12_15930 [Aquimarina atlantica]
MEDKLPRGVSILDKKQSLWRKLKCKEFLNIKNAGPYIYTMDKELPRTCIPHDTFSKYVVSIAKSSIYVLFHRGEMYRVKPWAFKQFFGDGIYYCVMFDDTFDWFFFTDDVSEDRNLVTAYYRNETYKS